MTSCDGEVIRNIIKISGDPRVSVLEDILPDGVRSTLIIREALDKYFGSYNCSVANAYGMDAAEIQLKKQSTCLSSSCHYQEAKGSYLII